MVFNNTKDINLFIILLYYGTIQKKGINIIYHTWVNPQAIISRNPLVCTHKWTICIWDFWGLADVKMDMMICFVYTESVVNCIENISLVCIRQRVRLLYMYTVFISINILYLFIFNLKSCLFFKIFNLDQIFQFYIE